MGSIQHKPGLVAAYLIAALLAANLVVLLARGNGPVLLADAMAQHQPSIAGGDGIFIMPAQLTTNGWGCYLLDSQKQTLCIYQFFPGEKQLKLMAARDLRADVSLKNFNTLPSPYEVAEWVDKEQKAPRGQAPAEKPSTSENAPK